MIIKINEFKRNNFSFLVKHVSAPFLRTPPYTLPKISYNDFQYLVEHLSFLQDGVYFQNHFEWYRSPYSLEELEKYFTNIYYDPEDDYDFFKVEESVTSVTVLWEGKEYLYVLTHGAGDASEDYYQIMTVQRLLIRYSQVYPAFALALNTSPSEFETQMGGTVFFEVNSTDHTFVSVVVIPNSIASSLTYYQIREVLRSKQIAWNSDVFMVKNMDYKDYWSLLYQYADRTYPLVIRLKESDFQNVN